MPIPFPILVTLVLVPLPAARTPAAWPAPGDLVINEIQPWPDTGLSEYVEILNRTGRTLLVPALSLADDRLFTAGSSAVRAIPFPPEGISLGPGEMLVVVENGPEFESAFPGVPAIAVPGWPVLNNGGDTVVLLLGSEVLDAATYAGGWKQGAASLERVDPAAPSESADNWLPSTAPQGGTPGLPNATYHPDRSPPAVEFAEQESATDFRVRFSEPVRPVSTGPITISTEPEVRCGLAETTAERHHLRFGCDDLANVDRIRVGPLSDLVGNVLTDTTVYLVRLPRTGDLALNEILYDPITDDFDGLPNQTEFVEVVNTGVRPLALRSCTLSDEPDEQGRSTTIPFSSAMAVLEPSQIGVLVADPTAVHPGESPLLDSAFPGRLHGERSATWAVARTGLGLVNSGESIRVVCAGLVVDSVRYAPDWHDPALTEARGRSLERRSESGPSNAAWNWSTSTAEAGATPGRANSIRVGGSDELSPGGDGPKPLLFSPDGDGIDEAAVLPVPFAGDGLLLRALVFDAEGRLVRRLESGRFTGSASAVIWDGRSDAGRLCRTGIYVIWVEGVEGRTGRVRSVRAIAVLSRGQAE